MKGRDYARGTTLVGWIHAHGVIINPLDLQPLTRQTAQPYCSRTNLSVRRFRRRAHGRVLAVDAYPLQLTDTL